RAACRQSRRGRTPSEPTDAHFREVLRDSIRQRPVLRGAVSALARARRTRQSIRTPPLLRRHKIPAASSVPNCPWKFTPRIASKVCAHSDALDRLAQTYLHRIAIHLAGLLCTSVAYPASLSSPEDGKEVSTSGGRRQYQGRELSNGK